MSKHTTKHYLIVASEHEMEFETHYGTALQIARDYADEGYEAIIYTSTMTVISTGQVDNTKGYELNVHL